MTNLVALLAVRTLEERKADAPDSLVDPPWSSSVAADAVQGETYMAFRKDSKATGRKVPI
jgi:hypothetical protein